MADAYQSAGNAYQTAGYAYQGAVVVEPPSTYPGYPVQAPKVNYNTRGRLQRHQGLDAMGTDSPFRAVRGRY